MAEFHDESHEHRGLVQFGPHSVQNRQQLAVWIAAIASVWALIEWEWVLMYGFLMGKSLPRGRAGLVPRHPVAVQIFEHIHGLDNRLRLVESLAETEATPEEFARVRTLKKLSHDAYKARSKIVHAAWGICSECPEYLILNRKSNEHSGRRYAEHDFKQVYQTLYDVQHDLLALTNELHHRLRPTS